VQVVVEGVETEAEREALALLGVRYVQGFLFARPTPPQELRDRFSAEGLTVASAPSTEPTF